MIESVDDDLPPCDCAEEGVARGRLGYGFRPGEDAEEPPQAEEDSEVVDQVCQFAHTPDRVCEMWAEGKGRFGGGVGVLGDGGGGGESGEAGEARG